LKRRTFLKGIAAVVPVAAALPVAPAFAQEELTTPVDILDYTLNLKYVQAEFYRQGNGRGLLTGREADFLAQIGGHKQAHVSALTQALSSVSAPVPAAPGLEFESALGTRESYLETAYTIEDTIVRAFLGMPAAAIEAESNVQFDTTGMFMVDARAAAVLGSVTGKPVLGGILHAETTTPMAPADVLGVLKPYVTGPWAVAGTAAVTE
jgi:hypothetical protein